MRQEHPEISRIDAEVLEANAASHKFFARNGYAQHSTRYIKKLGL